MERASLLLVQSQTPGLLQTMKTGNRACELCLLDFFGGHVRVDPEHSSFDRPSFWHVGGCCDTPHTALSTKGFLSVSRRSWSQQAQECQEQKQWASSKDGQPGSKSSDSGEEAEREYIFV